MGFDINNLDISSTQRSMLEDFLKRMLEKNRTVNMTRITDFEQGLLLHIEDSLLAYHLIDRKVSRIGDMGSGSGFPGAALAIATGRETDLIESVGKKARALEAIIDEMGLSFCLSVINLRVEEIPVKEQYDVVTARALASLPSLMELASPLLKVGGRLIAYKGTLEEEELSASQALCEKLGYAEPVIEENLLSDGITHRALVVYEKTHEALVRLPRRPGMAQKRPYK